MPLSYSTNCEEIAYSKDDGAVKSAADKAIKTDGKHCEAFFKAGEEYAGHNVVWINWKGDDYVTALLFVGTEAEVLSRLRQLPECSVD
ncbi:hypothetical protein LCGC14_1609570 [marine sediment metagenome]|uniref:Uncharacterized protein n=1 Tax=marine sediment metagenome TaxID=412755 RepID=A0A0F9I8Z8_9ZZZZ